MNTELYNEEMRLLKEAIENDDHPDSPCDDEILDILRDACVDLSVGDFYELDNDNFKRVFKANAHHFNTDTYLIMYDVDNDDDVALLKINK